MRTTLGGLWAKPIIAAPMAGGPTTVALAQATSSAGGLAFLAGAYRSATDLQDEMRAVRTALGGPFGVNVFVPGEPSPNPEVVDRYVRGLRDEAEHLGVRPGAAGWDDDDWTAKVEVLLEESPAVASFTFGCPSKALIDDLQRRGTIVMVTVTNPAEAAVAIERRVDALCAQGIEAGAHRGTFDDLAPDPELSTLELVARLTSSTRIPIVAAGGIAEPAHVTATLAAGAVAVQVGTALLRSPEAGTNEVHRAALSDPKHQGTVMTRAFTGRRARALSNGFTQRHPDAPSAFPEIHHATRPLRRAAASRGDADRVHLWAGTGFRHSRSEPAAVILDRLVGEVDG